MMKCMLAYSIQSIKQIACLVEVLPPSCSVTCLQYSSGFEMVWNELFAAGSDHCVLVHGCLEVR